MKENTPISENKTATKTPKLPLIIAACVAIIVIGLAVGWFVSNKKAASKVSSTQTSNIIVNSPKEAGLKDVSSIKDVGTATGTLKTGGIKGEGNYHLERPGGPTQTVYLISTTIDLKPFTDKKVQVWGLTQAAKYAPWFMDAVRIQVVE